MCHRSVSRVPVPLLAVLLALAQGCGSSSNGNKGPAPTLTSLAPAQGTIGTVVVISGTGFGQSTSGTTTVNPTVTFTPAAGGSGVDATVTSFSPTSLSVAVPAVSADLAAPGTAFNVTVANPGGNPATLTRAFAMAAPVVTDVNGGLAGSGTVNSVFILDGNNLGDLSAAPAAGLTYTVDFRDTASNAVVASAAVDLVRGNWANIYVIGAVPSGLAASTRYNVTVTTPSGTSAPLSFLVLGSVTFSPSTIGWTATAPLSVAQQGFAAVTATIGSTTPTTYIYALGGNTASATATGGKASNVETVYFDALDPATGGLAHAWNPTAALPAKRGFAAAVSANTFNSLVPGNGNLYVLGGLDGAGAATNTVYYASLAADGTVPQAGAAGTWAPTTALPKNLYGHQAVLFHGRIYVVGGIDDTGAPVKSVYYARILADGTLGAWDSLPDLPAALAYHQLVTAGGSLYVLGGDTAAADPLTNVASASSQGTIYAAALDIRNGVLAATGWTTGGAMGKNREKFSAVVAGGYILVSGGLYNGDGSGASEQSYASINTDGTVASFNGATGSHTISGSTGGYNFYNHASAYFVDAAGKPHVLILGGASVNTGAAVNGVWFQH